MDEQICISRATADFFVTIFIGTLLLVSILEWLNGRRIERLMAMLEEVVRNEKKDDECEEQNETHESAEIVTGDGLK
jgi:hypothetical protein